MSIDLGLNAGILGIQKGLQGARRAAATIASADQMTSTNPVQVAEPLLDLMQSRQQVQASARVVQTIHEMLGTLVDIKA